MNTLAKKNERSEAAETLSGTFVTVLFVIGILGSSGFLFAPFWVGGLIGEARWSTADAGFLMSAELVGAAIGSLAMMLGRTAWLTFAGLLILCLANAATGVLLYTAPDGTYELIAMRAIGGLGGGACLAATYVGLSGAPNPDRLFALFLGVTLLISGIGFYAFPPSMAAIGLVGLYGTWSGAVLLVLLTYGIVTKQFSADGRGRQQGAVLDAGAILLALFLLFSAQGAIWTFLEPISEQAQIPPSRFGMILALSSLAGFFGGLANALQGDVFKRRWPVVLGLLPTIVLIWVLRPPVSEPLLAIGVCGLQFFWCYAIPFLMGGLSERLADRRGMAAGVFVQLAGFGIGPLIISSALSQGGELSVITLIAIGFTALTLVVTYPALSQRRSLE